MKYDSEEDNRALLRAFLRWESKQFDPKQETLRRLAKMTAEMIRRQSQKLGS
jgi:ribosome biogenesis protein Tsr3